MTVLVILLIMLHQLSAQATSGAAAPGGPEVPAAQGAPERLIEAETPTGVSDGVNRAFTLSATPVTGTVALYRNGVLVGHGVDYDVDGNNLVMRPTAVPAAGDLLLAYYRVRAPAISTADKTQPPDISAQGEPLQVLDWVIRELRNTTFEKMPALLLTRRDEAGITEAASDGPHVSPARAPLRTGPQQSEDRAQVSTERADLTHARSATESQLVEPAPRREPRERVSRSGIHSLVDAVIRRKKESSDDRDH